jgi:hypothetical protein
MILKNSEKFRNFRLFLPYTQANEEISADIVTFFVL